MFEQALVVFARKGGGVEIEDTEAARARFDQAFSRMLGLTNTVRDELIARRVTKPFPKQGPKEQQGTERSSRS